MAGSFSNARRAPIRRTVSRHNFTNNTLSPRDPKKYITVRINTAPKSKRRGMALPSLPRQSKSRTLRRDAVQHAAARRGRRLQVKNLLVTALTIGIFITGGILALNGWRANHSVEAQAAVLTKVANAVDKNSSADPAPSTNKPAPVVVANYVVPPNQPKYLMIAKLGVKARIKALGVDKTGQLATPSNVYDTGWYNQSSLPGQNGAMLIDGHVSSWTTHGVFYGLKTLVPGDTMQVMRGDGTVFTYKVVKSQAYNADNVDMQAAMTSIVPGRPGLNLITCTGTVKPGTSEFTQRLVVFTEQI